MIDHGLTSNPWHVNGYNPTKVTHYPSAHPPRETVPHVREEFLEKNRGGL
jgi:hypothetical protein